VLDAIAAMKNEVQKQVDESIGRVRIDYYSGRKEFVSINGDVSEELRAIASAQREAAVTSLASQMPRITEKKILNMLTDEYKEQIRETVRQEVSTEMLAKLK
jgi:predicted membrane-bound dolichyl-phosphate-mannose-protein mannosyltransferase